VVDELYTRATPAQRDGMAAEFYSREYVLFPAGSGVSSSTTSSSIPTSLAAALEGAPPPRRTAILQRLATQVTPILDKGMLDPALTHRLVAEYLAAAPPRAAADAVDALAGPGLMRMVHTRDGAAAACAVLALGTAKDRKKAVKAMKGHVGTMARDEWASGVLGAALTHTDDTQLLTKVIGTELGAALDAGDAVTSLLAHKHARRVLLQVLEPGSARYLPPHTLALVYPVTAAGEAARKAAAAAAETAEKGDTAVPAEPAAEGDAPSTAPAHLGVSKKAGDKRRREVLGTGPASLGAKLLAAASSCAGALLRGPGADVLVEAARGGGRDGVLLDAHGPAVKALRAALVAQAAAPLETEEKKAEKDAPSITHALTDFYGSRALKHFALLAVPGEGGDPAAPGVAAAAEGVRLLWTTALAGRAGSLVKGHAAKVVAAVWVALVAGGDGASEEVAAARTELGKVVGDVDAWAGGVLKAGAGEK
jgi:pumilio family protein 6